MQHRLIVFILLIFAGNANARDLAVMLFSHDKKQGDIIYEENLKDLGLKRLYTQFQRDYHVSLGYIDDVEDYDVEDLKQYITKSLSDYTKPGIDFHFGAAATLGRNIPFIVAIPANTEIFINLNNILAKLLVAYKHHKYKLKKISTLGNYVPHLSLNGRIYKEIEISKLAHTLITINSRLSNKIMKLDTLIIN